MLAPMRNELVKIIKATPAYRNADFDAFIASMMTKGVHGDATADDIDEFDRLTELAS